MRAKENRCRSNSCAEAEGVGVGRGAILELDGEAIVEAARFNSFGFDPDIFNSGCSFGHFLHAGQNFVPVRLGHALFPLDRDGVNDGFRLANIVMYVVVPRHVSAGERAGEASSRASATAHLPI